LHRGLKIGRGKNKFTSLAVSSMLVLTVAVINVNCREFYELKESFQQWLSQRGVWGVQTPSIEK